MQAINPIRNVPCSSAFPLNPKNPYSPNVYQVLDIHMNIYQQRYSTVLHWTFVHVPVYTRYCVSCLQSTEKNTRHIKAKRWYGEHWGIIAFPTCSWRVESGPQQGRLEAVRYSPRAIPTCLGRPARLYRTTLAATSCYYTFLIEPRRMLLILIFLLFWSPNPGLFLRAIFLGSTQKWALLYYWALSYWQAYTVMLAATSPLTSPFGRVYAAQFFDEAIGFRVDCSHYFAARANCKQVRHGQCTQGARNHSSLTTNQKGIYCRRLLCQ